MNHKIRILNDNQGHVTAVVDINGTEYTVKLHTIGLTTAQRNKRVRELAQDQALKSFQ